MTPLETVLDAIKRKDPAAEMLALLRSRGVSLHVFEAAAAGDTERVRAPLDADPSLRDAHARDAWTPLHLAGHFRQTAVIDLLLARGADVNAVSRNADANAPLHAAAAGGADAAVMSRLVAAGARVSHHQSGGYTALHEVAAIGNAEVVRLLLAAGAQPDARTAEGETPAELARKSGHAAIADALDGAAAVGRTS